MVGRESANLSMPPVSREFLRLTSVGGHCLAHDLQPNSQHDKIIPLGVASVTLALG